VHAGEQAARALLANQRITCRSFGVRVDVTNHRPGGLVTSTVSCATSLADLGLSGLPVARTFMARSTAPIETYRSDTLGFANSEG